MKLIEEEDGWYPRKTGVQTIDHDDTDRITELLLGQSFEKVAWDHILLSNGLLVKVVGNGPQCVCSAGDYNLTRLADSIDTIITNVEFDYHPVGDFNWDDDNNGYYKIFVVAAEKKINLFTVEGSDGNGYYGTGFELLVRPVEPD